MKHLLKLAVALWFSVCASTQVSAQQGGELEVQLGGGYIHDSGEGPSTGAVNVGGIFWLSRNIGLGARIAAGLGDDHYRPAHIADDRTFLGPGSARQSALTLEFRASRRTAPN